MRKQTNTLSPSPKGFQSPKFSDSDFREVKSADSDSDVRKALGDTIASFFGEWQKLYKNRVMKTKNQKPRRFLLVLR
jgi:hypothetical protein